MAVWFTSVLAIVITVSTQVFLFFFNLCVYILEKMYFSVLTLYFRLGFRNGCVRDRAESFSEHERFAGKRA